MKENMEPLVTLGEYIKNHPELNSYSKEKVKKQHRFKNLSVATDYFFKKYPTEIKVLVSKQDKRVINSLFGKEFEGKKEVEMEYRPKYTFTFSENGIVREKKHPCRRPSKTEDLFEQMKQEFFENGPLTTISYKPMREDESFSGILLTNSEGQQFNIYFAPNTKEYYDKLKEEVNALRFLDFPRYCRKLMDQNKVKSFSIRPALDKRTNLLYIPNNEEYKTSLHKRGMLGYYFEKENGMIKEEELALISEIIRYFINSHLEENPRYEYKTNLDNIQDEKQLLRIKKISETLRICFDSKIELKITDSDLIYGLEKLGLIDDLYQLHHKKIDRMPEGVPKVLRKGEK